MISRVKSLRLRLLSVPLIALATLLTVGLSVSPARAGAPASHRIGGLETAIGCLTKRLCVAVGDTANGHATVVPIRHGIGGRVTRVAHTSGALASISCPSAKGCVALGTSAKTAGPMLVSISRTGNVTGSKAPKAPALVDFGSIACSSTHSCILVGTKIGAHHATYVVGSWNGKRLSTRSVVLHSASQGTIQGLSCVRTSCLAVGQYEGSGFGAVMVAIRHGKPSKPAKVPASTGLTGVACVSATTCYAVGSFSDPAGVILTVRNGTVLRHATVATAPAGISCDKGACTVAGEQVDESSRTGTSGDIVAVSSGTPGAVQRVAASGGYDGVARLGAFYEAVGGTSGGPLGGNTGFSEVTSG
jgi:hypothetical protein